MKKYFNVTVQKYSKDHSFEVWCASTLVNPKDHAVSFITLNHISQWEAFKKCSNCLVFWPQESDIPSELFNYNHVIIKCKNPHLRYCQFFEENNIKSVPANNPTELRNGAFVSPHASIGNGTSVFPGAYIGEEVVIGENCYIGSGVKMLGEITIGNGVIIRENTVIGADGLTTDRDEDGMPVHMPQFGGVCIGNHVIIGANSVIARGAIDDTIIEDYASIDNCTFISHNVHIGKRAFIVGETIMFGSSSLGDGSFISGNSTIRNGITIGKNAFIGMGSVVVNDVEDNAIVKGSPAK